MNNSLAKKLTLVLSALIGSSSGMMESKGPMSLDFKLQCCRLLVGSVLTLSIPALTACSIVLGVKLRHAKRKIKEIEDNEPEEVKQKRKAKLEERKGKASL